MTVGPSLHQDPYPLAKLEKTKRRVADAGVQVIDFGIGDPRDPTPDFIRAALVASVDDVSSYPRAAGLQELREAIATWSARRFGATLDPDRHVLPTLGSKEILHSLAAYVVTNDRNIVVVPTPAYPVYERGATFHGATTYALPLRAHKHFLPALDEVDEHTWRQTALLWLNYPNNPTGACAPYEFIERAAELARRHGFVVAFDEAYSEIWFDEPPASALQLPDLTNVLVTNTLSKRSCMTGYRSGFVAGDHQLIARLREYRPSVGTTPQTFVQRAAIAAWNDETHVQHLRVSWHAKRAALESALNAKGLHPHNNATFFLWVAVPADETSEQFAERLLDIGIVVTPGNLFGPGGEGYIRIALVPTLEDCRTAAKRIADFL